MNAADVMTRNVMTIQANASLADAIRLLLGQRISGLPVLNAAEELVGMLTEGDLLRRAELGTDRRRPRWLDFLRAPARAAGDYVHSHSRRVEDVMTREVVSLPEDAALDELVGLMESRHIRRVPIVRGKHLAGIVSRADLLRALAGTLAETAPAAQGDAALRDQVIAELRRQNWGGRERITVVVTDGLVYFDGIIFDARERDAMRVAAENIPGVKGVRDRLDLLDPSATLIYGM